MSDDVEICSHVSVNVQTADGEYKTTHEIPEDLLVISHKRGGPEGIVVEHLEDYR